MSNDIISSATRAIAAQYENMFAPAIILLAVPLAIFGAIKQVITIYISMHFIYKLQIININKFFICIRNFNT